MRGDVCKISQFEIFFKIIGKELIRLLFKQGHVGGGRVGKSIATMGNTPSGPTISATAINILPKKKALGVKLTHSMLYQKMNFLADCSRFLQRRLYF